MKCCGNCEWVFSYDDEKNLENESRMRNNGFVNEDEITSHAGDCCLGRVHNKDYYCASHSFSKNSYEYYRYKSLGIDKYVSINVYDAISSSWTDETRIEGVDGIYESLSSSFGQSDVTALIVNDLFGGKIMKCGGVRGVHYYNSINGNIVDLTKDQYDKYEMPAYEICEEVSRDDLLDSERSLRYKKLLANVKERLTDYSFEQINGDERIIKHKEFLDSLCAFSTFEIDDYHVEDDTEYVQFDLAAQNTGNIFRYKHDLKTDDYSVCEEALMYSMNGEFTGFPLEVIESVFAIARENKKDIEIIKTLNKLR